MIKTGWFSVFLFLQGSERQPIAAIAAIALDQIHSLTAAHRCFTRLRMAPRQWRRAALGHSWKSHQMLKCYIVWLLVFSSTCSYYVCWINYCYWFVVEGSLLLYILMGFVMPVECSGPDKSKRWTTKVTKATYHRIASCDCQWHLVSRPTGRMKERLGEGETHQVSGRVDSRPPWWTEWLKPQGVASTCQHAWFRTPWVRTSFFSGVSWFPQ
jgi:hypothetical protein